MTPTGLAPCSKSCKLFKPLRQVWQFPPRAFTLDYPLPDRVIPVSGEIAPTTWAAVQLGKSTRTLSDREVQALLSQPLAHGNLIDSTHLSPPKRHGFRVRSTSRFGQSAARYSFREAAATSVSACGNGCSSVTANPVSKWQYGCYTIWKHPSYTKILERWQIQTQGE